MNANLKRSYRKQGTGNVVFVYEVSGNKQELEAFAEAQGSHHVIDDKSGKPLWFTTNCVGDNAKLIITSTGNVVADMSAFDKANSIAQQYGGNLGAELARAAAQQLLGTSTPEETVADVAQAQPVAQADIKEEVGDDLPF